MKLTLIRHTWSRTRTLGSLFLADNLLAFTLEDANRLAYGFPKIAGSTAIPAGTYRVRTTYSPRFQRRLPELVDVGGFTGVRVHAGGTEADTAGCILVGLSLTLKSLTAGSSRPALAAVQAAIASGEREPAGCWIDVVDVEQPALRDALKLSWARDANTRAL